MRVITGSARGRLLKAPVGLSTRPTAARVKEAVMSMVQFEVEGAAALDLFAGSGQMGIETLSRGARSCVFVDSARASQEILLENLAHTKLQDKARLVGGDALSYLATAAGPFDIAFVDPPYSVGLMQKVLSALGPLMSEGGVILCESAKDEKLPDSAGPWALYRAHRYGKTKITVYRRPVYSEGRK